VCGQQFCRVLLDLAELSDHLHKDEDAKHFRALHAEMAAIINKVAGTATGTRAPLTTKETDGVKSETHNGSRSIRKLGRDRRCGPPERAGAHWTKPTTSSTASLGWPAVPAYTKGDERVRGPRPIRPGQRERRHLLPRQHLAIIRGSQAGLAERPCCTTCRSRLHAPDVDVMKVEPYVYCGNVAGPEHSNTAMPACLAIRHGVGTYVAGRSGFSAFVRPMPA